MTRPTYYSKSKVYSFCCQDCLRSIGPMTYLDRVSAIKEHHKVCSAKYISPDDVELSYLQCYDRARV